MTNRKYLQTLRQVASDSDAISQELFHLARCMEESPRFNPQNRLYSLVRCAETSAVQLRSLTARTMRGNTAAFYEELAGILGISVTEEKHWIRITVPAILPNRNARDNTSFITRPLRHHLIRFQRDQPIERFRECVICIVHSYDAALGRMRVRDYDNIETKRYIDVIEAMLLTNDSGLLCSVLQTTEMSDRDCTDFYIMLPETLSVWAKTHIKTHTVFHDKTEGKKV